MNFVANVKVNRITDEGMVNVMAYSADVTVQCAECGMSFEFVGVDAGVSPFHPTCSIDSTQLRVPIKPATGQLHFESAKNKLN